MTAESASRWSGSHSVNRRAATASSNSKYGTRIIRCPITHVRTPPARLSAVAPRDVDATSAPSVVAIGATRQPDTVLPSKSSGPASPIGTDTAPT